MFLINAIVLYTERQECFFIQAVHEYSRILRQLDRLRTDGKSWIEIWHVFQKAWVYASDGKTAKTKLEVVFGGCKKKDGTTTGKPDNENWELGWTIKTWKKAIKMQFERSNLGKIIPKSVSWTDCPYREFCTLHKMTDSERNMAQTMYPIYHTKDTKYRKVGVEHLVCNVFKYSYMPNGKKDKHITGLPHCVLYGNRTNNHVFPGPHSINYNYTNFILLRSVCVVFLVSSMHFMFCVCRKGAFTMLVMRDAHTRTPSTPAHSLQLYDDIYPLCGIDWYTNQQVQFETTNLNINIEPEDDSMQSATDNNDTLMVDLNVNNNNNDDDDDDDRGSDPGKSENGDDDEKIGTDEPIKSTPNKPPPMVPAAPKPKQIQRAGKFDCVLSPNYQGKHDCLIRREIRCSKYFFLYEQHCRCIMTIRNKDCLTLRCSGFAADGRCCCIISVGYVTVAIGAAHYFIIVYAPLPKCSIHRITCNIFNYKGEKDKLILGATDFVHYDHDILCNTPWLTLIPFKEHHTADSVRKIFRTRYHITQSLYKVQYLCLRYVYW